MAYNGPLGDIEHVCFISSISSRKGEDMGTRKVDYNRSEIEKLPNDKPVLYQIKTESGRPNYVGTAQRGRVQDRIEEHLGKIPGATVQIEQFSSIKEAQEKESRIIEKNQPKYNKQGK
jgi:excinuclease UvrABC nuclease subunit